jgi:hypothetical protein
VISDLGLGVVLTALAYGFLIWAVVHGKHVVDRIAAGEDPARPDGRPPPGNGEREAEERGERSRDGAGHG